MRILSEAMMNDPMMTQNLSDLFTEENLAELSAMVIADETDLLAYSGQLISNVTQGIRVFFFTIF